MKVTDLSALAIVFVVAGLALGVGSEVLQTIQTGVRESNTTINESVLITSNAGPLSVGWITSLTNCTNETNEFFVGTDCNLTSDEWQNTGSIATAGCVTYTWDRVNVTYDHDTRKGSVQALANVTEGTGELGKWIPTMGLVLAAAIIIGVVFGSIGKFGGGV